MTNLNSENKLDFVTLCSCSHTGCENGRNFQLPDSILHLVGLLRPPKEVTLLPCSRLPVIKYNTSVLKAVVRWCKNYVDGGEHILPKIPDISANDMNVFREVVDFLQIEELRKALEADILNVARSSSNAGARDLLGFSSNFTTMEIEEMENERLVRGL